MLRLEHIVKTYQTGEFRQDALKDVSIAFRPNEFVAILGQSGSGKTTMLNLIGGLDRYTSGDIHIKGVSTKKYTDRDWDAYRNRSIGFVFQSYNLIPHQSVLSNVELALTLAGVNRTERQERAKKALEQVGLIDHMHKRPNQLSGGQMQRVAIARALVNNPEILLADEPTGAIDSETSLQIMNLLQEIARDRLVIMVTHNPELAHAYANRIVKLHDGEIISDSNPYQSTTTPDVSAKKSRVGMGFLTALSLSFNNLKTKRGRTILTAFAGSIGIIGIALIMSLSSGMQDYIARMEEDTLSSYPITLQQQGIDFEPQEGGFPGSQTDSEEVIDPNTIYQGGQAAETLERRTIRRFVNDLKSFKEYLESNDSDHLDQYITSVHYSYPLKLRTYSQDDEGDWILLNPEPETNDNPMMQMRESSGLAPEVWTELIDNPELLATQFDVLAGKWPETAEEIVLVVDQNNRIRDLTLYDIGLKDPAELADIRKKVEADEEVETTEPVTYQLEDVLGKEYRLLIPGDTYDWDYVQGVWMDLGGPDAIKQAVADAISVKIVGIIRPLDDAAQASVNGTLAYTKELTNKIIERTDDSPVIQAQLDSPDASVLSGEEFIDTENLSDDELIETMPPGEKAQLDLMDEAAKQSFLLEYRARPRDNYDLTMERLGYIDRHAPSAINLYLKDFDSRGKVIDEIKAYNQERIDAGEDDKTIGYSDIIGLMTTSITDIIGIISYLLIGFVSISLVVSSIMIGIITYISVLERTKEIGILRSIGASKGDISRVFNAETTLIGLGAGLLGIGISLLLIIPINNLIERLSGAADIAFLPPQSAIILVAISMFLTILAGLIPARLAAKRDPVIALRSE